MLKDTVPDTDKSLLHMTFSSKAFNSEKRNARLLSEYIAKLLSRGNSEKDSEKIFVRLFDIILGIGTEEGDIILTACENEKKELLLKLEIPSSPETGGRYIKSGLENFTSVKEDKDNRKIRITFSTGSRMQ